MYRPKANSTSITIGNKSLDSLEQRGTTTRRRLSLDNSCLQPSENSGHLYNSVQDHYKEEECENETMVGIMMMGDEDRRPKPRRRLSLNNRTSANSTFLASLSPKTSRTTSDLDHDLHDSLHSSSHVVPMSTTSSCPDDDTFSDSEDSFCQASVAEPANRDYLRKDLGASCFWHEEDVMKMGLGGDWPPTNAKNVAANSAGKRSVV